MLGILFALLSAFSKGFEKILHRYILVKEDTISYAFIWHILSSLFFLPLFFIEFQLPIIHYSWILVIISSILWALVAFTGFKAYAHLEVSTKSPIGRSKLFFVLLFSVIFLKESLTIEKLIGTILIFVGIIIITYKRKIGFSKLKERGVLLTLLSAFLMSIVLLIDKYATSYFNPGMYSFLVYFLPAIVLFPFVINKKNEMKSIIKNRFSATIGAVLLGAAYYYLLLRAFRLTEASIAVPIVELGTLVAVFGGIIFLKEREDISKKLIAAVIVILGVILVSGII